jgi:hypothetical protein
VTNTRPPNSSTHPIQSIGKKRKTTVEEDEAQQSADENVDPNAKIPCQKRKTRRTTVKEDKGQHNADENMDPKASKIPRPKPKPCGPGDVVVERGSERQGLRMQSMAGGREDVRRGKHRAGGHDNDKVVTAKKVLKRR